MPLSDIQVRNLKPGPKARRVSDGGGLFLEIKPHGSKLWRMAYRFDGKQKLLSFGAYPAVSLAQARERRDNAKSVLATGTDPSAQRKAEKEAHAATNLHTFEIIGAELIDKKTREGLAETTLKKKRWLIGIANVDLGKMPIATIAPSDVLVPLRKVEALGNYETAKRLRTTIGEVFRYAIATARADNDPTFGLRGALIAPTVTHMAAATTSDAFGQLVRAIWEYEGGAPSTRAALKLMALLYTRPGELRLAYWDEFDLDKKIWTIPASRMKMRREHTKPLSKPTLDILKQLKHETGSATRVFPSMIVNDRPISENTMNQALRRMGFDKHEHTSHGFRASASSLLNESGKWNRDAIEAEIAHKGADQVRNAYHRATYWDERVKMADWWAGEIMQWLTR
jgi:integrase